MSHTDLIEVSYNGIVNIGKVRNKDAVSLRFGEKIVWILLSHLSFSWFDLRDRWKKTVRIQRWIVEANELEEYIYESPNSRE